VIASANHDKPFGFIDGVEESSALLDRDRSDLFSMAQICPLISSGSSQLRRRVLPSRHFASVGPRVAAACARTQRRYAMNWDQIEGKWKQVVGSAREKWGKLTDSDLQYVAGKKDQLVGRVQERYGIEKADADRQADVWAKTPDRMDKPIRRL
jgi:uncharacterized protein YjbJ (UPF0337 family)